MPARSNQSILKWRELSRNPRSIKGEQVLCLHEVYEEASFEQAGIAGKEGTIPSHSFSHFHTRLLRENTPRWVVLQVEHAKESS